MAKKDNRNASTFFFFFLTRKHTLSVANTLSSSHTHYLSLSHTYTDPFLLFFSVFLFLFPSFLFHALSLSLSLYVSVWLMEPEKIGSLKANFLPRQVWHVDDDVCVLGPCVPS